MTYLRSTLVGAAYVLGILMLVGAFWHLGSFLANKGFQPFAGIRKAFIAFRTWLKSRKSSEA